MKRMLLSMTALGLTLIIFCAVNSCAPRASLRTIYAHPSEITGTYTLFLYGAQHMEDLETVAVLAKEGTPYVFEIYSPEFDYKVIKGLSADEAYSKATAFVSFHHAFDRYSVSKILDENGSAVGYEVRPYYRPFEYGYSDVLDAWYTIQDGKIITRIRLKPEVERYLRDGNDRRPLLFRMR
jgi:hypothetical protein